MKILFVCIGNTCRSPMAEAVMKHWIRMNNLDWEVDSCALKPWNIGRRPDPRCIKVLDENGLTIKHYGRILKAEDFVKFNYIFGMDEFNVTDLKAIARSLKTYCLARIELFGNYLGYDDDRNIHDPYFSKGLTGFRAAFNQITECSKNFIRAQREEAHVFVGT